MNSRFVKVSRCLRDSVADFSVPRSPCRLSPRAVSRIAVVAILAISAGVSLSAAPTIGATAAIPASVDVSAATPVVITAQITDSTLIAGSVNLLKTDATGKTLATVGTMQDGGTNGDAVAGDKKFSLRVTINEPNVGQTYYRVSAAFKGVLQRTLSSSIIVTVLSKPSITVAPSAA